MIAFFDMLFSQNRPAGSHATDERQTQLFAQNVFELNAARSAGNEIDHAFALQGAQVLLGGIRRLEAEVRAISARVGGMPLSEIAF